ncbi:MAG: CocE/NonD family hydrolase [Casimicrobium sp.]
MDIDQYVRVPMRDGVALSARIWRPAKAGRFPVIMEHTPYTADRGQRNARKFVDAGFVFVSVDRRGRGDSEGKYLPFENTGVDGADAIAWLAAQPWSDGRVVTYGGSYLGATQWQTLAQAPKALATAVPTASVYPGWDFPVVNGIFSSYTARWLSFTAGRTGNLELFGDTTFWNEKYLEVYRGHFRFNELAKISGAPDDRFQRWINHPGYDAYWKSINPTQAQYQAINTPILSITGYFDGDQRGATRYYSEHQQFGNVESKRDHILLIGPWSHAGTRVPVAELQGLKFDQKSVLDMPQLHIDWYNHVLRKAPRPKILADRDNYYVMGKEDWRSAPSIDRISNHSLELYLQRGKNSAESVFDSGQLLAKPPAVDAPSQYQFDPRLDTTPKDWPSQKPATEAFIRDENAMRGDRLFFHSAPLQTATTVCGQIELEAFIEADVSDTDVSILLMEVTKENNLIYLGNDSMRGRYRHGAEKNEQALKPGVVEPWRFNQLWWTCRELKAGSRIRLTIAPLDSPLSQRNYHTGGKVGFESVKDARVATVRIHHNEKHPSRLRLPIIKN